MYCRHCGKEISQNSKFCGHCGEPIKHIKETTSENKDKTSKIEAEISKIEDGNVKRKKNINKGKDTKLNVKTQKKIEDKEKSKNIIIIIIIVISCVSLLAIGSFIGYYKTNPKNISKKYIEAIIKKDYKEAFKYLNISKAEYEQVITKYSKATNIIKNIEIINSTKITNDTMSVDLKCVYNDENGEKKENIILTKLKDKRFIIFNNWKVKANFSKIDSIIGADLVSINDLNLKKAILNAINKKSGYISKNDIENLVELNASNMNIESLDGIENLASLEKLNLSKNKIKSIDKIGNLNSLKILDLSENLISEADILRNLKNLQKVNVDKNAKELRGADFVSNINNSSKNNNAKTQKLNLEVKDSINRIINGENGVYSVAFQDVKATDKVSINSSKMKSASVIKLFIMIEAFDQIKKGNLSETETIVLRDSMKVAGTGILCGRPSGTNVTIYELIDLMMSDSDNTAANIMMDRLGMDNINRKIVELGCLDTSLQRKMMDQQKINMGIENYTSVNDLCNVLYKICNNKCLGETYDKKIIEIMKKQKNNSKIPANISNVEVANKTGELPGVENDCGIVITPKGSYVICILTDKISNESAKGKIANLSKAAYDVYMNN